MDRTTCVSFCTERLHEFLAHYLELAAGFVYRQMPDLLPKLGVTPKTVNFAQINRKWRRHVMAEAGRYQGYTCGPGDGGGVAAGAPAPQPPPEPLPDFGRAGAKQKKRPEKGFSAYSLFGASIGPEDEVRSSSAGAAAAFAAQDDGGGSGGGLCVKALSVITAVSEELFFYPSHLFFSFPFLLTLSGMSFVFSFVFFLLGLAFSCLFNTLLLSKP